MEERKTPRNGLIDVMRLGFAGLVVMYHFYSSGQKHFPGGFLGVEFFAILAGFLMFSAWERHQVSGLPLDKRQQYWLGYMKKRYIKFFWYNLIAFVMVFLAGRIWCDQVHSVVGISDTLSEDVWEILLVNMSGLNRGKYPLNVPAWTMSCMLFAEFFMLGMLAFFGKPFISLLMPLSLVAGIGYWANLKDASLRFFHTFFTFGVLRIYILTCCGILTYWICQKIKAVPFSAIGRWVLTGAELTGYTVGMLMRFIATADTIRFASYWAQGLFWRPTFPGK